MSLSVSVIVVFAMALGTSLLALGVQALGTGEGIRFLKRNNGTKRSWIFAIAGAILCVGALIFRLSV